MEWSIFAVAPLININSAWIGNYFHDEVWDEITYAFLKFNGATVEV